MKGFTLLLTTLVATLCCFAQAPTANALPPWSAVQDALRPFTVGGIVSRIRDYYARSVGEEVFLLAWEKNKGNMDSRRVFAAELEAVWRNDPDLRELWAMYRTVNPTPDAGAATVLAAQLYPFSCMSQALQKRTATEPPQKQDFSRMVVGNALLSAIEQMQAEHFSVATRMQITSSERHGAILRALRSDGSVRRAFRPATFKNAALRRLSPMFWGLSHMVACAKGERETSPFVAYSRVRSQEFHGNERALLLDLVVHDMTYLMYATEEARLRFGAMAIAWRWAARAHPQLYAVPLAVEMRQVHAESLHQILETIAAASADAFSQALPTIENIDTLSIAEVESALFRLHEDAFQLMDRNNVVETVFTLYARRLHVLARALALKPTIFVDMTLALATPPAEEPEADVSGRDRITRDEDEEEIRKEENEQSKLSAEEKERKKREKKKEKKRKRRQAQQQQQQQQLEDDDSAEYFTADENESESYFLADEGRVVAGPEDQHTNDHPEGGEGGVTVITGHRALAALIEATAAETASEADSEDNYGEMTPRTDTQLSTAPSSDALAPTESGQDDGDDDWARAYADAALAVVLPGDKERANLESEDDRTAAEVLVKLSPPTLGHRGAKGNLEKTEQKEAARALLRLQQQQRMDEEGERVEVEEEKRVEEKRVEVERENAERENAERAEVERQEAERQEAEREEAERQEAEREKAEREEAEREETEREAIRVQQQVEARKDKIRMQQQLQLEREEAERTLLWKEQQQEEQRRREVQRRKDEMEAQRVMQLQQAEEKRLERARRIAKVQQNILRAQQRAEAEVQLAVAQRQQQQESVTTKAETSSARGGSPPTNLISEAAVEAARRAESEERWTAARSTESATARLGRSVDDLDAGLLSGPAPMRCGSCNEDRAVTRLPRAWGSRSRKVQRCPAATSQHDTAAVGGLACTRCGAAARPRTMEMEDAAGIGAPGYEERTLQRCNCN